VARSPKPEWRIARGWTRDEIERRLLRWGTRRRNAPASESELDRAHGFSQHRSEALVALEPHGPPAASGPFEHGRRAVASYEFSDPRIVTGWFDRAAPLLDRPMLLELKAMGLRYLCPVRVGAVRHERRDDATVFGFRYDTLEGHLESGSEWFLLTKNHATGEVRFRIEAMWRPGEFPNAWSRIGFGLVARRYQRAWHRLAHLRLRAIVGFEHLPPPPRDHELVSEGPALACPPVHSLTARHRRVAEMEVDV
jgi:uncharacterized protein (UPF0548 family)